MFVSMTDLRPEGYGIALQVMIIKSALRDLLLCLPCCVTKSQGPLPLKGRSPAEDF